MYSSGSQREKSSSRVIILFPDHYYVTLPHEHFEKYMIGAINKTKFQRNKTVFTCKI